MNKDMTGAEARVAKYASPEVLRWRLSDGEALATQVCAQAFGLRR